ncbi:MAG: hypothetical protein WAW80_02165 [Candidatus Saccharimonadales bacterium]
MSNYLDDNILRELHDEIDEQNELSDTTFENLERIHPGASALYKLERYQSFEDRTKERKKEYRKAAGRAFLRGLSFGAYDGR